MTIFRYLRSLSRNNSGDSSKSFALVLSVIVGSLWLVGLLVILFVDLFTSYTITLDMAAMAALVTAIGGTIAAIYFGKVKSEVNEKPYDPKPNDEGVD